MTESSDLLILVEALWNIAHDSEEAASVKEAVAALTNTSAGLDYLSIHPLKF